MTDDLAHLRPRRPARPARRARLPGLRAVRGRGPRPPTAALPASYAAPGMPPVLDQHATPMCVAYSSSAMKAWQDRRDQERLFDFDEPRFFREIGGTAAGAYVRDAMNRMRAVGYPVIGSGDAGHHKIAAYYAVPRDLAAIKAAIHDLGPVVVSTPWYQSWFRPAADVAARARRAGRRARDRRLRLGRAGPAPAQLLGRRLGRRRRLLDARRPRPADQRRLEGRGRDRAPDPLRAHGRRHRAAEPQRPAGADHGRREGRLARPRARRRDHCASRSTAASTRSMAPPAPTGSRCGPAPAPAGSPAATPAWSSRRTRWRTSPSPSCSRPPARPPRPPSSRA